MKNLICSISMLALLGLSSSATAEQSSAASEGVQLPAIQQAPVEYPRGAYRRGMQGDVLVRYRVNADGRAENIEVLESSNRVFNDAAVRAVRGSIFATTMNEDEPVAVDNVVQRFEFVFDQDR